MSIIPCWGIHSDEVGLRYLVQGGKPINAHGISDSPKFIVKSMKRFDCPHNHHVEDLGIELTESKGLDLFSPIPSKETLYYTDLDLPILSKASEINNQSFNMRPAWSFTEYSLLQALYASNISTTVIYGLNNTHSKMIKRIINSSYDMQGTIILKGHYLFPNTVCKLELDDMPDVAYGKDEGQQRMFNYMKETNA